MRGEHPVVVRNNKVQIKLPIRRNLTILQGKSATGKTTLIDLVSQYEQLGESSGVTINCDVPCHVLSGKNWQRDLAEMENCIVFIEEDNASIDELLEHPVEYIESSEFFSWETFFTRELVERTRGSYLAYSKSSLNATYLQDRELGMISSELPDLGI